MRLVALLTLACSENAAPLLDSRAVGVVRDPFLLSHDEVVRKIGPHRLDIQSHLRAWDDKNLDQDRVERIRLEVNERGDFHLTHDIGQDAGKEAVFVEGLLYSRHRYGTFLLRDDGAMAARKLRDEAWGTLAAHLEVAKPSIEWNADDVLAKRSRPQVPMRQHEAGKKWRESVRVTSVEGKSRLENGVPVEAKVKLAYTFSKPGHAPRVELEYSHTLTPARIRVKAPEGAIPTPIRKRLEEERRRLLGGGP